MSKPLSTKWLNFFERVVWTLLQVASAQALIQGWDHIAHTHVDAFWTIPVTVALAAIKNAAAQAFGSPSGATLPQDKQPVLAEKVLAIAPPPSTDATVDTDRGVAWTGSDYANGEPVRLVQRAA